MLFWIAFLAGTGATYVAVDKFLPTVAAIAVVGGLFAALLTFAFMFNKAVGLVGLIETLFEWASGISRNEPVTPTCEFGTTGWSVLLIPVDIAAFASFVVITFGLPYTMGKSFYGGYDAIQNERPEKLKKGLAQLFAVLSIIVATGLLMRFAHFFNEHFVCV